MDLLSTDIQDTFLFGLLVFIWLKLADRLNGSVCGRVYESLDFRIPLILFIFIWLCMMSVLWGNCFREELLELCVTEPWLYLTWLLAWLLIPYQGGLSGVYAKRLEISILASKRTDKVLPWLREVASTMLIGDFDCRISWEYLHLPGLSCYTPCALVIVAITLRIALFHSCLKGGLLLSRAGVIVFEDLLWTLMRYGGAVLNRSTLIGVSSHIDGWVRPCMVLVLVWSPLAGYLLGLKRTFLSWRWKDRRETILGLHSISCALTFRENRLSHELEIFCDLSTSNVVGVHVGSWNWTILASAVIVSLVA